MSIIAIILLFIIIDKTGIKAQYLENIDYQVVMNKNGSMQVTETWDININKTNTLFKTFNLSNYKYGNITNVKVRELNSNVKFQEINTEMYHVPEGYYYGLKTNSNTFEIAWGTGMESKFGNKKYEISYLVSDVVTDYEDCQEIYWQFLAKGQNAIPARKVTGNVTLPQSVSNIDNLMVWGHGQLNGEMNRISKNKVSFEMGNLNSGSMLEIRIITKDKMFNVLDKKVRRYNNLNNVLKEENRWSQEANEKSQISKTFIYICIVIYIIIIAINILKIFKYYRKYKNEDSGNQNYDLKYYREIPREDATPAEAVYLYNFDKERLNTSSIQKKAVAATILNLCLKRKIQIEIKSEDKKVYIKIIDNNKDNLGADEAEILSMLEKIGRKRNVFEIEELNEFAEKNIEHIVII